MGVRSIRGLPQHDRRDGRTACLERYRRRQTRAGAASVSRSLAPGSSGDGQMVRAASKSRAAGDLTKSSGAAGSSAVFDTQSQPRACADRQFRAAQSGNFHVPSGAGYRYLSEQILRLDALNPQMAARLVKSFSRWKKYEPGRRTLQKCELEKIAGHEKVSRDVFEVASKSLG